MSLVTGAAGDTVRAVIVASKPADLTSRVPVLRGGLSVADALDACPDEDAFPFWPFSAVEAALAFSDAATKHARCVVYFSLEGVCHHLEQQTGTRTARMAG